MMQCSKMQCDAVQYDAALCDAAGCISVQYVVAHCGVELRVKQSVDLEMVY